MNLLAILSILLLCAALAVCLFQRRNVWRRPDVPWPLHAKRLRANPEQQLYQRLVSALPGHTVLCRVPLTSVLGAKPGSDPAIWTQRLRHLQYDFVVCTRDARVLAAIALNDAALSGTTPTRQDTIERASTAAGIRLLVWQARALPDQAQIQAELGEPLTHFFEEVPSSANQSWWPPIASNPQDPFK